MTNLQITPQEFAHFQRLIHDIAGVSLADSKMILLVSRLGKRVLGLQLDGFGSYYDLVCADDGECQVMIDLITTHETYFFREQTHFDYLRDTVIAQHPAGEPLSVWSAAASTGEEVYTLAMVLADCLGLNGTWRILGSDISTQSLATARRGQYWLERTRGLPPAMLHKYCLKGVRRQAGSFIVAADLRRNTRFQQINLNVPLPDIGRFHVVFLRNVMIYFDEDTKREVVRRIIETLHPGGYLFVGHSESLSGLDTQLETVRPSIYRLPTSPRPSHRPPAATQALSDFALSTEMPD